MMGLSVLSNIACWSMVRVGTVSHDFHTFVVLAVSTWVGVPSLAFGATGPTGWSFKCIKTWDSTLEHPTKIVFSVSNLICCFHISFFLSTNVAVCGTLIQCHGFFFFFLSSTHHDLWNVTPNHHLPDEGIHTWYSASLVPSGGSLG